MKRRPVEDKLRGEIINEARKTYGIEDFFQDYVLYMAGEGKIRITTREVSQFLEKLKKVDSVGLYVAKYRKWGLTLSIEGSQLLGDKIRKNVIELSLEEAERWMRGDPIPLKENMQPEGKFVVGKYRRFYLGTGVVGRDGKIYPQVPKWRRIPQE